MQLKSAMPGRERWKIGALVGRPRLVSITEELLAQQPEITSAVASPLTGGLLIRYNTDVPSSQITKLIRETLDFALSSLHSYKSPRNNTAGRTQTKTSKLVKFLAIAGGTLLVSSLLGASLISAPVLIGAAAVTAGVVGYKLWSSGSALVTALSSAASQHPAMRL